MNEKNKKLFIVAIAIAGIFFAYKIFNKDGASYSECMENRRNEVQNVMQKSIAAGYCRSKFPLDTSRPFETNPSGAFSFEEAIKPSESSASRSVRMPDGTIVKDIPSDITDSEVLRRYNKSLSEKK